METLSWLTTVEHPLPDRQLHLIFKHWKSSEPEEYTKQYLDDKYQDLRKSAISLVFIEEQFDPGQDKEIEDAIKNAVTSIQSILWENCWYQDSKEHLHINPEKDNDGFHRYYYDFTPFQRVAKLFGYELRDVP